MMENVNPQTFWFSAFSDKAALEALQSKERMMSKHPKIVQGPEGIWMENQQCLPQKSHFRFMFLGYRFPGYLFCQHGPSIMALFHKWWQKWSSQQRDRTDVSGSSPGNAHSGCLLLEDYSGSPDGYLPSSLSNGDFQSLQKAKVFLKEGALYTQFPFGLNFMWTFTWPTYFENTW